MTSYDLAGCKRRNFEDNVLIITKLKGLARLKQSGKLSQVKSRQCSAVRYVVVYLGIIFVIIMTAIWVNCLSFSLNGF